MSTTPSSNLWSSLAFLILASSSEVKWPKTRFCTLTFMPSMRLRKCLTLSLSSEMPAAQKESSASSRYACHRSCRSPLLRLSPRASRTCAGGGKEAEYAGLVTMPTSSAIASRPHRVSTSNSDRSEASAARRSPRVSAPRACSRLATVDANRRSPPHAVIMRTYCGPWIWLERCVRPHCWMAWSALHGSSSVMCTRRRRFCTRRSACSEMPEEAASEMMATSFSPAMKADFSCRLMRSIATSRPVAASVWPLLRLTYSVCPVSALRNSRPLRPVSSATMSEPPSSWMSVSSGLSGRSSRSSFLTIVRRMLCRLRIS
mmetsp:Transcript_79161/g.191468  ORF Transcript_79161/g.191468 Transcript_79161/m.191468 type:complete len:316 (+) Transcript_79161:1317-2264(+)